MTDEVLLERLRAGDEQAFMLFVRTHSRGMHAVARSYVRDPRVAEEVVQEAWAGVIVGLSRFKGEASLKTWLYRIVSNRAKTRGQREARSVPFSALGADETSDAIVDAARFDDQGAWTDPPRRWEVDTPEAIAGRRELLGVIERALEGLPPRQRAVVVLRDVEGLDSDEVCEMLDLSATNQRVLLHRGRVTVRAMLEKEMGGRDADMP